MCTRSSPKNSIRILRRDNLIEKAPNSIKTWADDGTLRVADIAADPTALGWKFEKFERNALEFDQILPQLGSGAGLIIRY